MDRFGSEPVDLGALRATDIIGFVQRESRRARPHALERSEALAQGASALALEDIDAPLVTAFLDDLETVRGVTARTRNLRLTAVHSSFRYASYEAPTHAAQIARVLAIPATKFARALVPFLSRAEVDALLAAPDQHAWSGRRDHALMLLAVHTGLRLSELIGLRRDAVNLGTARTCGCSARDAKNGARR